MLPIPVLLVRTVVEYVEDSHSTERSVAQSGSSFSRARYRVLGTHEEVVDLLKLAVHLTS